MAESQVPEGAGASSKPCLVVYTDATFENGVAFVGFTDNLMKHINCKRVRCSDNNAAEIRAVELSVEILGDNYTLLIKTDSAAACRHFGALESFEHSVMHVSRSSNLANSVVHAYKEVTHRNHS